MCEHKLMEKDLANIKEKLHEQDVKFVRIEENQLRYADKIDDISKDVKETLELAKQTNGRVTDLEKYNIRREENIKAINLAMGKSKDTIEGDIEDLKKNTKVLTWINKNVKITILLVLFVASTFYQEIRDFYISKLETIWFKFFL